MSITERESQRERESFIRNNLHTPVVRFCSEQDIQPKFSERKTGGPGELPGT